MNKKYNAALKTEAVRRVCVLGEDVTTVSRNLGITLSTLKQRTLQWSKEFARELPPKNTWLKPPPGSGNYPRSGLKKELVSTIFNGSQDEIESMLREFRAAKEVVADKKRRLLEAIKASLEI